MTFAGGEAAAECDPLLVSHWRLDERTGTVTVDSVSHRRGSLNNGAVFGEGRVNGGVVLDGLDDFVSGPLRLRTDTSFTVTAWLNVREVPPLGDQFRIVRTAVSIDGDLASRFRLGHVVDRDQHRNGAWVLQMPESDTDLPLVRTTASTLDFAPNTWVFVAGVYDAQSQEIWLYVNGLRQDFAPFSTPWQATGGVRIGHAKVGGTQAQFWPGSVDDVRFYRAALDKSAIEALYASFPPRV